jgi:hypothetical protein
MMSLKVGLKTRMVHGKHWRKIGYLIKIPGIQTAIESQHQNSRKPSIKSSLNQILEPKLSLSIQKNENTGDIQIDINGFAGSGFVIEKPVDFENWQIPRTFEQVELACKPQCNSA